MFTSRFHIAAGLIALLLVAGCASSQPYALGPIKTVDPDRRPFASPEETEENQYWDRIDLTLFYQLEKPLDLNWTGRQVGQLVGVAGPRQADNVNVLDEPPNSSWYQRRHYYDEMTPAELAQGPNVTGGPDTSRALTVVSGKSQGAGSGFVLEDARGDRYIIKLDGPKYPELASSAEVISTKLFYAAGYYVPENYVTYLPLGRLQIAGDAVVTVGGGERPMTRADLETILAPQPRTPAGTVRALASKYVGGRPYGPWDFRGTRADDPNDRVRHEHRRELRGMRVLSAWLNDADRRAANTLAVYTDEQFYQHYVFDFGSTLGANSSNIHKPIYGQAYLIDPRYMARAAVSFGFYEFPWNQVDPAPAYPSVGYFRADVFRPGDWVMTYPNPAFQNMTARDAFWGAKLVTAFTDEDLEAIVATAQMTDPEAEAYLLRTLKERRDATGRHWFGRVNPLDRFRIEPAAEAAPLAARSEAATADRAAAATLRFDDLAVTAGPAAAEETRYVATLYHKKRRLADRDLRAPALPLTTAEGQPLAAYLDAQGATAERDRVVRAEIRTVRERAIPGEPLAVYVLVPLEGAAPRVVGVERREK